MIHYRPTIAEISISALRHNLAEIRKRIPKEAALMAIVKANAYGHGAVICSRALTAAGVEALGVATVEEGIELREAGLRGDIFVLGGLLGDCLKEFSDYRLKPVLHQLEDIDRFGEFLNQESKDHAVHLKMDTGMGRLGFFPHQTEELFARLQKYFRIKVEGVMTHLARADEDDPEPTKRQFLLFEKLKEIFEKKGLKTPVYHLANSAAIIDGLLGGLASPPPPDPKGSLRDKAGLEPPPQRAFGAGSIIVRPGIMLYGAHPHPRHREKINLKPVMKWQTRIMALKKHPKGSALSYGGTFVTEKESLIAILPVGYADGYPRLVGNRGSVLVRGCRAPVVGRVCMDLTLVDVTDVPGAAVGDEVVLIGPQGKESITAEEVAQWVETISYEILCGVSSRIPRVYVGA